MIFLTDLFREYRKKRLRYASNSTINQFEVTLGNFYKFLNTRPRLCHLRDDIVEEAMAWMISNGRSNGTANKLRSNLVAIWRYAADKQLIRRRPDVEKLKEPYRVPIIWSRDQLRQLWDVLQVLPGTVAGTSARVWWLALHGLLWDTGERIGAVLKLKPEMINLSSGEVVFLAETRKWKKGDKSHILHPHTCEYLRQLTGNSPVFSIKYDVARLKYRKILQAAGLPFDRKHLFQCLRKSTGSFFEAAGGNATELYDHESRSTTVFYYLNRTIQRPSGPSTLGFHPHEPDRAA